MTSRARHLLPIVLACHTGLACTDDTTMMAIPSNTVIPSIPLPSATFPTPSARPVPSAAPHEPSWPPAQAPGWPAGFVLLDIPDSDGDFGVYRRARQPHRPLVIALHTWSGDGLQRNFSLLEQAELMDWNYFHPDLGGPNDDPQTCCSELLLRRLDRAVSFAVSVTGGLRDDVHIVGASGGGYTALCYFMSAVDHVASIHAWVPITDLVAWHHESIARGTGFDEDILACTNSESGLDVQEAERRSPLHMVRPDAAPVIPLGLYAGIHDGHEGSVPTTHALRMFDRLAQDSHEPPLPTPLFDAVAAADTESLVMQGMIGDRAVWLDEHRATMSLTIFEGGHELLDRAAALRIEDSHHAW